MNLWLRLIWLMLTARRRGRLTMTGDASILQFRVWPNDLDPSLHMNNGRYLTLMDLGRLDILARSGLLQEVLRRRWTPIASAITIRYRRELRLMQSFRLETRLVFWDATHVVMEQVFVFARGPRDGQVAARALFKGGIYDRSEKKFVEIAHLMRVAGATGSSPPASSEVEAFMRTDDELRQSGRS
jgi:acyl-CoA thioesterase FadM